MQGCLWRRPTRAAVALAGLLLAAGAQADGDISFVADGELTFAHDSNVSRAERERDIIRDQSVLVAAGAALRLAPSFNSALNLRAFAEAERWLEAESLERTTLGGQAIFRGQTRRGYTAPIYQAIATVQQDDYGVDQRDSTLYTLQALVQRRLTNRVMVNAGLEVQQRKSDGTVFDTEQARLFGNMDYVVNEHVSLYGVYSFITGDTFSSAQFQFCNGTPATDNYYLIAASEAFEPDQAFNADFCGNWVAYRLKADTHSLVLGINRGFGHHISADLSVQQVNVEAEGGISYERTIVRAGLLGRF